MSYLRTTFALRQPIHPTWVHRTHTTGPLATNAPPAANWPHAVHNSSRIIDRKSVFLAHASILPHPSALPDLLEHLRALPRTNAKRATHCMYAYRASGVAGQSDGGEGGSGDRLARLLRLSGCEDVVVVVWRWYGGVKLGADRWKCISKAAREALDSGGFLVKRGEAEAQSKKGKKK
ncbi:ribosomal protein S5 domain 2-type protein [Mycena vitilis]|nr:ribosomal protein S5 domain 2-type protein [Mycena vitilis]